LKKPEAARVLRASLTAAAVLAVSGTTAAAAAAKTLYVAKSGSDANACTKKAACATIGHAVGKAHKGDTVKVAAGTYAEMVTVSDNISLVGSGATIDAAGLPNGVLIDGINGKPAGAVVRGFTVEHANFEGILAQHTSRLKISGNEVRDNDLGMFATSPTGECAPNGQIPGDCGEGIHLMSVTNSHVTGNTVTANSGGILLTDELGPTARNTISGNRVLGNLYDCGITVAGHNPNAISAKGKLAPKTAGIYRNTISKNVSNGNGIKGEGAGILLAVAGPGAAVYDNLVQGNTANNNNLAGVTLHLHAPGSYLNGNKIIGNRLSNDGLGGDPDFGVKDTIGILVGSAANKLKGTVISGNRISDVHFGIWTENVPTIKRKSNKFHNVNEPLTQTNT
jgi:parallel beta-helix repeat protein